MASSSPIVSVLVPTYQHAAFIEQCIQGILMQETSFPVEVLIGEDESIDGTRAICQRLAAAHPERVRLFLRSRKDVIHIMGRPTGRANILHLLGEAKGKYIAICEGDDHWTDPFKLQKQVDAMEADPQAAGCFTDAWNVRDGVRSSFMDGKHSPIQHTHTVDQAAMVNGRIIPTCTFLCRRDAIFPLSEALWHSPVADVVLYIQATNQGHLRYLPEYTAVRNMHAGGIISLTRSAHKYHVLLALIPVMDKVTSGRHHETLAQRELALALAAWGVTGKEEEPGLPLLAWQIIARNRRQAGWSRFTLLRAYLQVRWPRLERMLGMVWDKIRGRPA